MSEATETRIESDSMGEMPVPSQALYGASTQRAVLNFPVSDEPVDRSIISAYGLIKWAAARVNGDLGLLSGEKAALIQQAAGEIRDGEWVSHFPVDVYQTGSGTSTNMNVNEVIANRCAQLNGVGLESGWNEKPVHPNDDVNRGQSSNDTFPTAIHIAATLALRNDLLPALEALRESLEVAAERFREVVKVGRTHLMDATPVRLGQEFQGYAKQIEHATGRVKAATKPLEELPLGGTAVGTGLNTHPEFAPRAIALIAEETRRDFREATCHFEAQSARDGVVECHGQLNTIATSLFKIANDIRLLGSGPRCAIGEIALPPTQPGSSIMPGKVNPVMCEMVTMAAARVFGNQATVTWCGANGQLELNTFMPVMAKSLLESIRLLTNAAQLFGDRCIRGIEANPDRCHELVEQSLSLVTALAPLIGYDRASKLAKQALETGRSLRELCLDQSGELGLSESEITDALDPGSMADGN